MEEYRLPILFSENEKMQWQKWAYHDAKYTFVSIFPTVAVFILAALFDVWVLLRLDRFDHSLFWMVISRANAGYTPSFCYVVSFCALVLYGIIIVIFNLISSFTMKKPDIAKHAVIQIDMASNAVAIKIITDKKKKILACENVSISEFSNLLNVDTNSIMVEHTDFTIGKNQKEDIFLECDKNSRLWIFLGKPADVPRDIQCISKIDNIIHEIILSKESEKESLEWESKHMV